MKKTITDDILNTMNIKDSARCNEELEKVKEKYRNLIDNSPDGIVIVYDGRVVFEGDTLQALWFTGATTFITGKKK